MYIYIHAQIYIHITHIHTYIRTYINNLYAYAHTYIHLHFYACVGLHICIQYVQTHIEINK